MDSVVCIVLGVNDTDVRCSQRSPLRKVIPLTTEQDVHAMETAMRLPKFYKNHEDIEAIGGTSPLTRGESVKTPVPTLSLKGSMQTAHGGQFSPRDRPPLPPEGSRTPRGNPLTPRLNHSGRPPFSPEVSPKVIVSPRFRDRSTSPATTPTRPTLNPGNPQPYSKLGDWHNLSMDHRQAEEILRGLRLSPVSSRRCLLGDSEVMLRTQKEVEVKEDKEVQEGVLEEVMEAPKGLKDKPEAAPALDIGAANLAEALKLIEDEYDKAEREEASKKEPEERTSAIASWHLSKARQMVEKQPVTLVDLPMLVKELSSETAVDQETVGERPNKVSSERSEASQKLAETLQDPALVSGDPDIISGVSRVCESGDFGPLLKAAEGAPVERTRAVVAAIRALTRQREASGNRQAMGMPEGVSFLLSLLDSEDAETVEHSVTILLNLSLEENLKQGIFSQGCDKALVKVLRRGSQVAQENAAAALYLLTNVEERQEAVGSHPDAIPALLDLLRDGNLRGQKDSALALFNLSLSSDNRKRIIAHGGVPLFLSLLKVNQETTLEEKVLALLEKSAKEQDGRMQMVLGNEGIEILVDHLESKSDYCKTEAVSTLLILTKKDPNIGSIIAQEAPLPALSSLSRSGSERLKKKAKALYNRLKSTTSSSSEQSHEVSEERGPDVSSDSRAE